MEINFITKAKRFSRYILTQFHIRTQPFCWFGDILDEITKRCRILIDVPVQQLIHRTHAFNAFFSNTFHYSHIFQRIAVIFHGPAVRRGDTAVSQSQDQDRSIFVTVRPQMVRSRWKNQVVASCSDEAHKTINHCDCVVFSTHTKRTLFSHNQNKIIVWRWFSFGLFKIHC